MFLAQILQEDMGYMKLIVDKEAKEKAGFDCSAASASPSLSNTGDEHSI